MANYNVYIGMPAYDKHYVGTLKDVTEDEAYDYARDLAYDKYESYAGMHGIPSYDEIYNELLEFYDHEIENGEYDEDDIRSFADDGYAEAIESWAIYYVKEESSDTEFYESYDDSCKGFLN